MVKEAEKFKEDEKQKSRIEAKNQLENFCYSIKNQINEQFANKISPEDKTTIENISKETLDWMDANQNAPKEEYEAKLKECEGNIPQYLLNYIDQELHHKEECQIWEILIQIILLIIQSLNDQRLKKLINCLIFICLESY